MVSELAAPILNAEPVPAIFNTIHPRRWSRFDDVCSQNLSYPRQTRGGCPGEFGPGHGINQDVLCSQPDFGVAKESLGAAIREQYGFEYRLMNQEGEPTDIRDAMFLQASCTGALA